jgi:hypothetical protein
LAVLCAIADPAERLKALGRPYVAFGVANPRTYRLIFMEDPSYTGAALDGAARASNASGASGAAQAGAFTGKDEAIATGAPLAAIEPAAGTTGSATSPTASVAPATAADDPGAAALQIMLAALEELRAAGRLPASMDAAVWAQGMWATLHGIVALNLTCPVFPTAPLDTVVAVALDAWLGRAAPLPHSGPAKAMPRKLSGAGAKRKSPTT